MVVPTEMNDPSNLTIIAAAQFVLAGNDETKAGHT